MISEKAYGKILVFGAYSILEPGNVGLVVNVNKGTTATIEEGKEFWISLPDFDIKTSFTLEGGTIRLIKDNEKLNFMKSAIEYSFRYLNYKKIKIKPFKLTTKNDYELSPFGLKSGLGSSATSVVSSVSAILKFHNAYDKDIAFKISRYAHYMAQGSGSGFDIAAAVYGSHFFSSEKFEVGNFLNYIDEQKTNRLEKCKWPSTLLPLIIFTGKPASTKELVSKVLDFKSKEPGKYKKFMQNYNNLNLKAKEAFEKRDISLIKETIEESWAMRKQLGMMANIEIESESMSKEIRILKENGAYTAGLIGAGGGDSILGLFLDSEKKSKAISFLKAPAQALEATFL